MKASVVIVLWHQVIIVMQEDDDLSLRLSAMKVHKSRLEHEKEQATQRCAGAASCFGLAAAPTFCWLHMDMSSASAALMPQHPCAWESHCST